MSGTLWVATDPNRTLVSDTDPLTASRDETWRWDVLTVDDAPTDELDGVEGCTLNFVADAAMRGGGSLSWSGDGSSRPNWAQIRLQPWYRIDTHVGWREWPLGVFLPMTPGEKWTDEGVAVEVALYDKTLVLDQDKTTQTTGVQKGAVVTDKVREIILGAGEEKLAIVDSTETLTTAKVWEPDTSKLTIVNELLAAINYTPLWCDGYGTFRAEPYVAPALRGVARVFKGDGSKDLYAPDFAHTRDLFSVPNRLRMVAKADSSAPALTSVVTNDDPASPTSTVARGGRLLTVTETDVDATSQAILDEKTAKRLRELSRLSSEVELEAALGPIPLEVHEVIAFDSDRAGIDVLAEVQRISIKGGTGGDSTMTVTVTEVLP